MEFDTETFSKSLVNCKTNGALIGTNGKVWPCCFVHDVIEEFGLLDNPINKYFIEDKDWNNIYKKSLKEICEHEVFTKHFNVQDFCNKNSINPICLKNCKK